MRITILMPVGVPRVAYALSEDQPADWVDLYNCLYRERYLFLCQELTEELSNNLLGIMLYLNGEEGMDDLFLYVNSPGGQMTPGVAVYDGIGFIDPDVNTICLGRSASIASFVIMGGTTGKRTAGAASRMMIHQPAGGTQGQGTLITEDALEVTRLRNMVMDVYCERTGQSKERIRQDFTRDEYMTPQQARAYGLVDQVGSDQF